jgi:hypothetical protein
MMQASTTVFTMKDIIASRGYFRDRLGFSVAFEWGQPTFYVVLFADKVRLHLIEASHVSRPPGHGAMTVDVDDVDKPPLRPRATRCQGAQTAYRSAVRHA